MGYFPSMFFTLLLISSTSNKVRSTKINAPNSLSIQSPRLLDLIIRDYTLKLIHQGNFKTGEPKKLHLPANLSGIEIQIVRFRCGSLRRYGGRVDEFHIGKGITINPFVERAMLMKQELGFNWSLIYYNLNGYELITPILGLLAYNGGDDDHNVTTLNPFQLHIIANDHNPIRVYFTNVTRVIKSKGISGKMAFCAYFEGQGGKITLTSMVAPNVCEANKLGHFGLVVKNDSGLLEYSENNRMSRWKVAVVSSIGAILGAFLLGLLMIAMFAKAKKRSKMDDMVRRAYQEEALQVSMVGHVRAPPSRY